jgi:hypothetical protein
MPLEEEMSTTEEFDVLLSFAGPERHYARAIYEVATANGLRVFLDEEFQAEIWGKNLVEYLHETYRERGRFVVGLISKSYCDRAYTKVERRAALDRLINQDIEYFLPVCVDDSWIPGLPKSTAYLDIRKIGVLGVCDSLLEKVFGKKQKLSIPDGLRIPRVPSGSLPSGHIAEHLLALCSNQQVTIFGALIYDETTVALRKLLTNQINWDALDVASGPHFEIFAVRDEKRYGNDEEFNIGLATAVSMHEVRDRGYYYSHLLKEYFGEDKTTLVYPSVLLFIVEGKRVRKCWLIPGHRAGTEETLNWLVGLCTQVRDSISAAGGQNASSDTMLNQLKTDLLTNKYTLYIQSAPSDADRAVAGISQYVENDSDRDS